jgi:hypothetical protein
LLAVESGARTNGLQRRANPFNPWQESVDSGPLTIHFGNRLLAAGIGRALLAVESGARTNGLQRRANPFNPWQESVDSGPHR